MATVHEFTHALDWTLTTDRGKIERNTISNVGTSLASPAYVVNFNGELLYTILISPKGCYAKIRIQNDKRCETQQNIVSGTLIIVPAHLPNTVNNNLLFQYPYHLHKVKNL